MEVKVMKKVALVAMLLAALLLSLPSLGYQAQQDSLDQKPDDVFGEVNDIYKSDKLVFVDALDVIFSDSDNPRIIDLAIWLGGPERIKDPVNYDKILLATYGPMGSSDPKCNLPQGYWNQEKSMIIFEDVNISKLVTDTGVLGFSVIFVKYGTEGPEQTIWAWIRTERALNNQNQIGWKKTQELNPHVFLPGSNCVKYVLWFHSLPYRKIEGGKQARDLWQASVDENPCCFSRNCS